MKLCWDYKAKLRPSFLSIVESLEEYLSIEFSERSFYHNGRPRNVTETSSLITDNDNLSDVPESPTDLVKENRLARESFV